MIGEIFARIDAELAAERASLRKQKEKLEAQQLKVLQSFHDDAIGLPILKHEQQRIQDDLDQISARLDTFEKGCADAQVRIRAYLALATNSYAFYTSLDPANRRLCNQAFFTKIILTENREIRHEYTGVYDTILDPANRLHADYWQRTNQLHPDVDPSQLDTQRMEQDRVGTSNIWWS